MHVTLVHVHIKPAYIDDFIAATRLNHEASIQLVDTVLKSIKQAKSQGRTVCQILR